MRGWKSLNDKLAEVDPKEYIIGVRGSRRQAGEYLQRVKAIPTSKRGWIYLHEAEDEREERA